MGATVDGVTIERAELWIELETDVKLWGDTMSVLDIVYGNVTKVTSGNDDGTTVKSEVTGVDTQGNWPSCV